MQAELMEPYKQVSINTCRAHNTLISYQFGAEQVQFDEISRIRETN